MALQDRHSRRQTITAHFQILKFTRTANGKTVERLRKCSLRFKKALSEGDTVLLESISREAWSTMHDLALLIRKSQDNGVAAQDFSPVDTGWIVENLSLADQQLMLSQKKLDRRHPQAKRCSLRICLNKLAHPASSTYRVDGRGAHYIVLTGPDQRASRGPWVCEFNVNTFAAHCAKVIAQFP